ncbi:endolytic transglycosylase MltG [Leucobacter sp. M11]|uniref:endolytic transglycosylase MltG n=1 Tax=Leucobacter sp. M11 TaxID=2993565 RepID=UPI002D80FD00|nr:endolytic transglycosylase MltG [Leucobacter sp. M11]MEB4616226.1 endolytic transglycosylase MltG [Leucobacter sp. M11]
MSQPSSRRRRILISVIVTVVLLGGLGAGVAVLWSSYGPQIQRALGMVELNYDGAGEGEVVITVKSGDIGADIAQTLAENGVVKTAEGFNEYLIREEPDAQFQPGAFLMRNKMSPQAAVAALLDPANRMEMKAVIPEGKNAAQVFEYLSAAIDVPVEEFTAASADPQAFGLPENVPSLEGWLFPATYEFEPNTTATQAIQRLVTEMVGVLDRNGVPEAERETVLNKAAMVEREAGRAEDMGKVARVIENRLAIDMKLGMDSTAQYGVGEQSGVVWSSDEALADENAWNTYKHTGLPVGPIANPGEAAIQAVLAPEPGDWLYFVAVDMSTGASEFTTTLEDHEQATKKLVEWCSANPDYGC